MREIILAKYGELALKGLNRGSFESALLKTIRSRVSVAGAFKVSKAQSTIYIQPEEDACNLDEAARQLSRVFGIAALNRAAVTEKNMQAICATACEYLDSRLGEVETFKVTAKRSDKAFPLNSMQISEQLGGYLLERYNNLHVRMTDPDLIVSVEVRDFGAYVHAEDLEVAGGMPGGTGGRAAVLLSGGIDSPVAAHMMAKRGMDLCAIHYMSPPYTSERALDKVVRLAKAISLYTGNLALLCVPFTEVQLAIRDGAPSGYNTIIMRRSMVRIAQRLCEIEHCSAMITGESLGQVASQTMPAIACTDAATSIPILRPLIGMDKNEIVERARKIQTFDISIEPYEDCCTVFTPRHPKTKPRLEEIEKAERGIKGLLKWEEFAAENYSVRMLHFSD